MKSEHHLMQEYVEQYEFKKASIPDTKESFILKNRENNIIYKLTKYQHNIISGAARVKTRVYMYMFILKWPSRSLHVLENVHVHVCLTATTESNHTYSSSADYIIFSASP